MFQLKQKFEKKNHIFDETFVPIFKHCGDSDLLSTHLYFEREVKSSFCFSAL